MEEDKVKRRFLFIAGPVTLFIILIGVTYAFFNYTRTGAANSIRTGNIYFNSDQNNTLSLTNIFPMKSTEAGNAQLDSVTVGIVGNTTYADGEEFEVTLIGVNNTINGKEVPMNYIATYTATTGNTIGESSSDYWNDRLDKDANMYTLNASGDVKEGKQVLVGYVDNEGNGINGTLTIKAYIDADRIAISDTYYENAPTPTPTAPNDEYGTTTEWVDGRTVLTTAEWNSLSSNAISFKIKVESNEGIWASPQIDSCIGCKYIYPTDYMYTTWNMSAPDPLNPSVDNPSALPPTVITSGLYDNYKELINTTGKDFFIGVKLNGSNQATNAYACGIIRNTPFCIEGSLLYGLGGTQSEEIHLANMKLLQSENIYNDECYSTGSSGDIICIPDEPEMVFADTTHVGAVDTGFDYYSIDFNSTDNNICSVGNYGVFICYESEP